jgi:hypothetical protein
VDALRPHGLLIQSSLRPGTCPAADQAATPPPRIIGRAEGGRRPGLRREHLRIMRGLVAEKKLDPLRLFYRKQAVERAMSGISSRNMMCSSMRAHQPGLGAATSIEATGQSGQSKLHTTALRPGPEQLQQHGSGPAVKRALGRTSSPCAQPQLEARSGLGWPESTTRWTGTTCLTVSLTCVH